MNWWARLTRKHVRGTVEAEHVLNTAYRSVFSARADTQQAQMVLSDLGASCGWNQVTYPDTADQRIWFNEGKRAAFSFIFSRLSLSPEDVAAFENAIRHEAVDMSKE